MTRRLRVCESIATGLPLKEGMERQRFFLPKEFNHIPMSNKNFILDVKELNIRNVFAPYNPSLIESENGYLVFFRYDIVKQMHLNIFHTYVGCAELDANLNQTAKEFVTIDTETNFAEDPRIVRTKNALALVYNTLNNSKLHSRAMHIAQLNLKENKAANIEKIDLNLRKTEKNWPPFTYTGEDGVENVLFEYLVAGPRQILNYSSNSHELITCPSTKDFDAWCTKWTETWGEPLGGTSSRLVDGEYLSFFHSKFKSKEGNWWYVMGAYTFEAKPPFRITAVSTCPILFDGIYDTPALNTASPDKYVIFPCGFAVEKKEGKTLIHLGCGENDSAIKIVTMDKDELVKSLHKVQL